MIMTWLSLVVFHSREASPNNSASTRMENSTLKKKTTSRIPIKNSEMMRNKKDIMENLEVMANMVTENTTKNITPTVEVSSSGLVSLPSISGT